MNRNYRSSSGSHAGVATFDVFGTRISIPPSCLASRFEVPTGHSWDQKYVPITCQQGIPQYQLQVPGSQGSPLGGRCRESKFSQYFQPSQSRGFISTKRSVSIDFQRSNADVSHVTRIWPTFASLSLLAHNNVTASRVVYTLPSATMRQHCLAGNWKVWPSGQQKATSNIETQGSILKSHVPSPEESRWSCFLPKGQLVEWFGIVGRVDCYLGPAPVDVVWRPWSMLVKFFCTPQFLAT